MIPIPKTGNRNISKEIMRIFARISSGMFSTKCYCWSTYPNTIYCLYPIQNETFVNPGSLFPKFIPLGPIYRDGHHANQPAG